MRIKYLSVQKQGCKRINRKYLEELRKIDNKNLQSDAFNL